MKTLFPLQKRSLATALAFALVFPVAGCGERTPAGGTHGHGHGTSAEQHADHGEHGAGNEKITHFSERTELFVEFPRLVAGQPAEFAAHLTRLADFRPLGAARLTLVLSGGGAAEERFAVDGPAVPGIFKPTATPTVAGEREMTIVVEADDPAVGKVLHELGPVTVFPDAKAAEAAPGSADDEGIVFLKEQQWKVDFATVEAATGSVRASVAATATIKAHPDGEAQIVAPATGLLRPLGAFPRVGQAVRQGQVLAMLAPRLGGETDQATLAAAAGKAKIALEQARRERERLEALFKDEAVPERRVQEARTAEQLAQAEYAAAQARVAQLDGSGGGIALRAPIDGTIAHVDVAPGAYVSEGAALFHLANTRRLWLEARVPESEVGRLARPSGASFTVDGFERSFAVEPASGGRLIAVGGVVDAVTRTVPVIFEFANPDGQLRLGMTARALIYAGSAGEAVRVPASAVQDESGTPVVYVQTGGESFERRIVQTGARDGEFVAILAGVDPGQRVVSRGAYLIRLSTSKLGPSGHAH